MPFPTVGSWNSNILASSGSDGMEFIATFTTGSSKVEYSITNSAGSVLLDYQTAAIGSNDVDISSYTTGNAFRVFFRFIGYPSMGFNPKVESFQTRNIGAQLQTTNLGSDVNLSTTKFTNAMVQTYGSLFWLLTGSVSSDGGNTWTPVPSFNSDFELTSTTGSEPMLRLVDTSGSVVLTHLTSYFHGSDIN